MAEKKDQPTDGELVERVLAGEHDAFQPLMERYQQPLFGYLYRLNGRDPDAAADLLQSVFLKAFQSLSKYDASRPFSPWLYRIAHNEAANNFRSHSRKPTVSLDDTTNDTLSDKANDPEQTEAEAQESTALRKAVDQLPDNQKAAVMLHYFEERSYEEVAEILGVRLGTVGTLLNRARGRLAEQLAALGEGK